MRDDPLTPAQRDFLAKLKGSPAVDGFYLGGGSAIALRLGHRQSLDHDLFRREPFQPTELQREIAELYGPVTPLQLRKGTLTVQAQDVKASFFHYPYPLLHPTDDPEGLFPTASLLDLALMKLTAIADRGLRKDFIDFYAILQAGATLDEVFARLPEKFPGANYQVHHFARALTWFEDAKEEPLRLLHPQASWAEVQEFFRREISRLRL